MRAERMAIVAGWEDTRSTLRRWQGAVPGTLGPWALIALGIAVALLVATYVIARLSNSDPSIVIKAFPGNGTLAGALGILRTNCLVLLLHALICVAGYIATTSAPLAAEDYSGWSRRAHLVAPPVTIAFIAVITALSLARQAWDLGNDAPYVARAYGLDVAGLLLRLLPHAIPELVAIFLPLGAWFAIARRRAWSELLAASIVTVAGALPVLVVAALVEEFVAPMLIHGTRG